MDPKIKIEKVASDVITPERAYPTDSGIDVWAYGFMKLFRGDKEIEEIGGKVLAEADSIKLNSFDRVLISTGVKATVAPGYEIQVRPRSGLALKQGLSVLNTPGTVDEQYRGIVGVILVNLSGTQQIISKGDKVAQLVVCKVVLSDVELIDSLEDTQRGSGGFGSTGSN